MNNRDIAKLGVQIASEDLCISEIEIIFKDSAFFYNSEITAMFVQKLIQFCSILIGLIWHMNLKYLNVHFMKRDMHIKERV